jgi:cysteinyl-tRNA synthetase
MSKIKLYNTLTRKLEEANTLEPNMVKMYTCGLTVYSQPHIGNWVGYIYWDVLQRTLEIDGYEVHRVQNYTDVGHLVSDDDSGEDKMEKGARTEGKTAWEVADKYIDVAETEGYKMLGLVRPKMVRATDCIDEQINFLQVLENKGYTYEIPNEGIYFDTSKLSDYGKLARLDINGLKKGARVDVEGKKNVTDFALWKFSPKDKKRDMEWESPWGVGFPGWHLECSVIAKENLGDQIDIHCGGIDHIPVHHTNEIAQTEAYTERQFSQIWVHNNHLKVDGGKMAKSLGNIYTLEDIVQRGYKLDAFKVMVLSSSYQTEGNFTWEIMESAKNRLKTYESMADLKYQCNAQGQVFDFKSYKDSILTSLNDNIDTPKALATISEHAAEIEKNLVSLPQSEEFQDYLEFVDSILGLNLSTRKDITSEQKELISDRAAARNSKDWDKSDNLREQLHEQGINISDRENTQIWYRTN